MDWEVWAYSDTGNHIFIAAFATQDLARWWAISWARSGYLPLEKPNPVTYEAFVRLGDDIQIVYIKPEGAESPDLA